MHFSRKKILLGEFERIGPWPFDGFYKVQSRKIFYGLNHKV